MLVLLTYLALKVNYCLFSYFIYKIIAVEPLNNGHTGGRNLVLCMEVVPISEVD